MIIGHELLVNGYQLKKFKTKKLPGGPDFLFDYKAKKVWVEVVTAREGEYPKNKWRDNRGNAEIDENNCKLKLASVVWDKTKKYAEYMNKNNGIVKENDIKIICVNVFPFSGGSKSCPYMFNVLYGIEEETFLRRVRIPEVYNGFVRQGPIVNNSDTEIKFPLFVQEEYKDIDGVLCFDYSLDCSYPEEPGMHFYANLNRRKKIGDLFDCWDYVFYENDYFEIKGNVVERNDTIRV